MEHMSSKRKTKLEEEEEGTKDERFERMALQYFGHVAYKAQTQKLTTNKVAQLKTQDDQKATKVPKKATKVPKKAVRIQNKDNFQI